jgi:CBS domain-containing membrane protein
MSTMVSEREKKAKAAGARKAPAGVRIGSAVRDLMTEEVVALLPGDDLTELLDRMADEHIRHMPIVDREGDLVGLVTDRSLAQIALSGDAGELTLSAQRELLRRRRIREIMTTEVDTVEPDQSLREAAELLLENKIGCLPVVEGRHVVGILTESDFVRRFLEKE